MYICEMITARGLVMGDPKTADMLTFPPEETIRSVQTYGVDPASVEVAIDILCAHFDVDHVDLNFGCPAPKATRRGGGGVLPWKLELVSEILRRAVKAADRYGVPVTLKTRIGIDERHTTFLDMGRLAEDNGIAAICLHARTVAESYSGSAHWEKITDLVEAVDIPVLGNGDIWEASDALDMVAQTGCAGVEIGRGCLGRPWLFRDLAAAFSGHEITTLPTLGEICALMKRHARLLADDFGEVHAMKDLRKHTGWYLKGFPIGGTMRAALAMITSLEQLDRLLDQLDPNEPFPASVLGKPRGRQGSPRSKVAMPHGWLDDRCGIDLDLAEAEMDISGG